MKKKLKKQTAVLFKRWSRKNYSAFASMHKVVKICVLSFTFTFVANATIKAFADTDSLALVADTLDRLEIFADKDMLPNATRSLVSLTATEIDAVATSSLNQIIRTLPSIDLRQRGAFSVQADLSIRGASFDQSQVFINGINFSDSKTGHHNLDLCIDLQAVDRIEVLQGGITAGTIGGAINFITDFSDLNSMKIGLSGGSFGYFNVFATAKVGNEKIRSLIALSHQQSKGYIENTDFLNTNLFSNTQFVSKAGIFDAQIGILNKAFGSNSFYSFAYPNEFEHVKSLIASLSYKKQISIFDIYTSLSYRRNQDKFELVRNTKIGRNDHLTDNVAANIAVKINTIVGQTRISVEYKFENILSNTLGNIDVDSLKVPFEYEVFFLKKADRHIFQACLEHSYVYKNLAATANISYFYNNIFKNDYALSGDIRYAWNKYFLSFAAINQAIRIPTFTDLYYKGGGRFGNSDLKPEKSTNYEVGTSFTMKKLRSSLSIFYRQGHNLIDWAGSNGELHAQNYNDVAALGTELQIAYQPENIVVLKSVSLSYSYLNMNKSAPDSVSSYLLDYMNNKLNINILHNFYYKNLTLNWNFTLYDRNGSYTNFRTGKIENFKPFMLLNLKLNWEYKCLNIFFAADNVFNTQYFDFGGLIQPGVFLSGGIVLKVNFIQKF